MFKDLFLWKVLWEKWCYGLPNQLSISVIYSKSKKCLIPTYTISEIYLASFPFGRWLITFKNLCERCYDLQFYDFDTIFPISEDSNTDDHGNFQETFIKQIQNMLTPLLVIALFLSSLSFGAGEQQQVLLWPSISFPQPWAIFIFHGLFCG